MSSEIHLKVLPLSVVSNLVSQKCLLPRGTLPPASRPGAWMRAVLNSGAVTVCQVFTRNDNRQPYAYMDQCVRADAGPRTLELEGQQLERLELLHVDERPAKEIEVIITVTERLFRRKNLSSITLSNLVDTTALLLQSVHLVSSCTVSMPTLEDVGIASVHVILVKGNTLLDALFHIDDDTRVTVGDVRLQGAGYEAPFLGCSFEQPRQELQELFAFAELQRHSKHAFRPSLNAIIVGATGSGKSALAAATIRDYNCNCFRISSSNVLGQYPGETEVELRRIYEAALCFEQQLKPSLPTVILLEDLNLLCPPFQPSGGNSSGDAGNARRTTGQLVTLVDQLQHNRSSIICLATSASAEALNELTRRPGRFQREIAIARPTAEQRRELFATLWRDSYMNEVEPHTSHMLDLMEQQTHGYVIADLISLVRAMERTMLRSQRGDQPSLISVLKETLAKVQPAAIRGAAVSVTRAQHGFSVIGGMQQLKRCLEVTILAALQQRNTFERFGVPAPKGVLLYGPPGCAKTSIAKCMAKEANYNFIHTSSAEVYSPYVGCAEKFIMEIFDTARKNAPCIIFLDEIDSLVGRRAAEASDVQIRILATLLTEMDGIIASPTPTADGHILVVAATNRPNMVDAALLRPGRFDKLIHVPPPDAESRLSILELHQKRMSFASDVDLAAIAERTEHYSGADMCNICNEAALAALQRDFDSTEVTHTDFESVLTEAKSSLTREQINWFVDYETGKSH